MFWFIIEIIILIILGYKMLKLLFEDTLNNIRENFYNYLELSIYSSIMIIVTIFTWISIFNKG